ncbi:MAG: ATP-dependent RNA helicase RhlE [Candidatus Anoxychlamydiales bacterium]|nr:ATP-dependent RNA helicase RhlE [Candidatus Anoxychlamydiales bacterium]
MTFKNLNLDPKILQAVERLGYKEPTLIQEKAIPEVLNNKDLFASAQTGTGKTAAFLLPALNKLVKNPFAKGRGPRVLVLVPTRELAMQVAREAITYSKYLKNVKTVCIYGGVPYPQQRRDLSRPYEILVATPGRLIDHLQSGRIKFSRVEMFILDEADRMLDMGFIDPVNQIANAIEQKHQTLLFSATLKDSILNLVKNILKEPIKIKIPIDKTNIEQKVEFVRNLEHKIELLEKILEDDTIKQAIIFTSTKHFADELKDRLQEKAHRAKALHGDIPQSKRTRTINQFREGKIRLLIATDVAARGIDIAKISHIINFDLPSTLDDYIHRIGRTGRIGKKGLALSFASSKDRKLIPELERFIGQKIASFNTFQKKKPSKKFSKNFKKDSKKGFKQGFKKRDKFSFSKSKSFKNNKVKRK